MSKPPQYMLVSLPTSISPSNDYDEAFGALRACLPSEASNIVPFSVPEFKIGTLDTLVQQAEELAKLESSCEAVTSKVGDTLRSILDGDEEKIAQQKVVNDKPVAHYLSSWSWNKNKYRVDKPIGELMERFSKEISGIDIDVKNKYNTYNVVKTNLTALQKRQTGNLATKSLASIVPSNILVQNSEYIETHLIAVPIQQIKEFLKTYETVSPWVVPRSAQRIDSDSEYTLYTATTFKKYSQEFLHKCREQKWTPRDFKFKEAAQEDERKELDKVSKEERKLWGETLRLGRTSWSEAVEDWIHVLTLRVFVETVLRYGLPLSFVCALVKGSPKQMKKIRATLDDTYGYLAGNAMGRDKKGRAIKDESADIQAAGQSTEEYSAYVCYEFEIN